MATIECLYGSYQGRKVSLREGQIFVGRSVSHGMAFPDDPFLSATHAVITVHQGQCYVADLGSKNGTFLNGLKIDSHEHHIKDGSIVRFGQQEFRIRVSNTIQTATTPPPKVVPPPAMTVGSPSKVAQSRANEPSDKGFAIQLVLCPLCRQQIAINLYGFGVNITCSKCKSPFLRIDAIVVVPPSQQPASAQAPPWVPSTRPTSQITIPPSIPGVPTPSTSDSDPVVIKPKSADSTYVLPKQPNVAVVDPLAKFKEARWFGRGTVVSFGDWKLVDPLCYVGLTAGASDPSTVDPSLPAHVNSPTQQTRDGLSTYKDLSSKQRYLYLQWLASGRTTTCSENLLLLFLQGVERRLLELPSDSPEKLGLFGSMRN